MNSRGLELFILFLSCLTGINAASIYEDATDLSNGFESCIKSLIDQRITGFESLSDVNVTVADDVVYYTNSSDPDNRMSYDAFDIIIKNCHINYTKLPFYVRHIDNTVSKLLERVDNGLETLIKIDYNTTSLEKRDIHSGYGSESDCESVFSSDVCRCDTASTSQAAVVAQEFSRSGCECPYTWIYFAEALPWEDLRSWISNPRSWYFSSSNTLVAEWIIFRPTDTDGISIHFSYGMPVDTSYCLDRYTPGTGGMIFTGV